MSDVVKVGMTVNYRDVNGDTRDAIVAVVNNQDDIDIDVPHLLKTSVFDRKTNVARSTTTIDTDVFIKRA